MMKMMMMMVVMALAFRKFQEMHFTLCVVVLVIKNIGLLSVQN
jgi:hypothetical protein